MNNTFLLLTAVILCLVALLLIFVVVLKPRQGSIPLERRRPEGYVQDSVFSRFTGNTVSAVDGVIGNSGGPYNAAVLYNAGVKSSPADFTIMVGAASIVMGLLGTILASIWLGIILAVLTPLVARLVLVLRTEKRRAKFDTQLTDTIQTIIGSLRAGHSIMRSIDATAQESEAPTSEELGRIVNENRVGKDVNQAIEEAATRMDSEDFFWIAQAIQIHREVGGDLAEVLDHVLDTIRERAQIKGQIRALSAEGKLSGYILMALPIGLGIFLSIINPGYFSAFTTTFIGMVLMVVSILMFIVGGFWLSRIVKIKF